MIGFSQHALSQKYTIFSLLRTRVGVDYLIHKRNRVHVAVRRDCVWMVRADEIRQRVEEEK